MSEIPLTKFFESNELEKEQPVDKQITDWLNSYKDKQLKPLLVTQPEIKKVGVYFKELDKTVIFQICTVQYLELTEFAMRQMMYKQ